MKYKLIICMFTKKTLGLVHPNDITPLNFDIVVTYVGRNSTGSTRHQKGGGAKESATL